MNQQTNSNETPQVEGSKKPSLWVYALVVTVILVGVIWLLFMPNLQDQETKPQTTAIAATPVPVVEEEPAELPDVGSKLEPSFNEPVEQVEPEMPMASQTTDNTESEPLTPEPIVEVEPEIVAEPVIEKDDNWLMAQLLEMLPSDALIGLLNQDEVINNFVVFVDNASRGELLTSFSPLTEPESKFKATEDDGNQLSFSLNPDSYQRYDGHATLIAALPIDKSLEIYQELRESIDNAHQQLGYAEGTFDNKLTRLLDYLLDTPVVDGEIKLVAPSAMYQFAEPELEELMAVQKLLIRMGPSNQRKVQKKLAEFRNALN